MTFLILKEKSRNFSKSKKIMDFVTEVSDSNLPTQQYIFFLGVEKIHESGMILDRNPKERRMPGRL